MSQNFLDYVNETFWIGVKLNKKYFINEYLFLKIFRTSRIIGTYLPI